jgi:hypothetical protein
MAIDREIFLYMDGSVCEINRGQIVSYSKWVEDRLSPSFGDWESEVESEYNKMEESKSTLCCREGYDFSRDMEDEYEQAISHALNIAEVNSYMLAMAIVGLYHIFEKQVVCHIYKELSNYKFKKMVKIKVWEDVVNVFRCFSTDLKSYSFYDDLDELRLFSNAVKHGPGPAFIDLQKLKADILINSNEGECLSGGKHTLLNVDVYPNMKHFTKYKKSVLGFWDEGFWRSIGDRRFLIVD